ncbi:MAG: hypothetical protein A2Y38_12850 [Spirochaetes bacterium GWB1_59_5]|nr:MAG: hypothetical protein A2Y38_12850 [Spirochaetes bacterium GWB1_59_5]
MPNVAFIREELKKLLPSYGLIRDCIEGEMTVKKAGDKYLPRPNSSDISPENVARYKAYKERAVFYNVTQRTLAGLAGAVFLREPVVEVPTLLDVVNNDANGGGVSLTQLAKRASLHVLAYGRSGLLVDYPVSEAPASRAQLEAGDIRPTINVYSPFDIINWRTVTRGARELLSLVVLHETYVYSDDGFEMKKADQWRVLQLTEAGYAVSIWRKGSGDYTIFEGPHFPKDASGGILTEIPFSFIGCENNDDLPDLPPLYDLASLNIAHYRNSADYEESCFIVGQPTPYFSGLTEEWVTNVLKGTIALGARGAIPLPVGGDAGLLQASPNTLPFEAMQHKERQMVALGAKLVEQSTVQRTATEADIENASETSTLASAAKNVSAVFKWALTWCAKFVGVPETGIQFDLHTDFDLSKMTPQERAQLVAEWQAGAIAFEEMRNNMRRAGIATLDDAAAKTAIAEELASAPNLDQGNGNQNNPPA